jgi:hypothetical protein
VKVVFSEQSDRVWLLEEFSPNGLLAAQRCAKFEGANGWVSDKLVEVLERLHPDDDRLTSEQTARVEAELALHVVKMIAATHEAIQRGQQQARACLGSYGKVLDEAFDATTQAATAIGKWLAAYAEFVQPMKLEWAGKTKRRKDTCGDGPRRHADRLEGAIKAAHANHPEWPVKFGGVVRLHPRARRPVTCVAAIVEFEGHGPLAVLWQAEVL